MKIFYYSNNNSGFITLISVLVVGAVSLAVAITLLTTGVNSSKTAVDFEASKAARIIADSCAEEALEKIRETPIFSGAGSLNFNQGGCSYSVVDQGGQNRLISASSTSGSAIRKVLVSVNQIQPRIIITSWKEVADF